MNNDDIMQMAEDAGALVAPFISLNDITFSPLSLKRFADKVAEAEREACAKVCDVRAQGHPTCKWSDGYKQGAAASAAGIRARGEL